MYLLSACHENRRPHRNFLRPALVWIAVILATCWSLSSISPAMAQNSIVEEYFVPLPEAALFQSFDTINSDASSPLRSVVSIAIGGATVVTYDQWENGYEASLASPLSIFSSGDPGCPPPNPAGTQIWGNGNLCDGVPPDFDTDTLSNGDVITLDNRVDIPRDPEEVLFDGRDKFGASYPVAVTRTSYPIDPGSVLAGGVEVFKTNQWGVEFRAPVGQDLSSNTNAWQHVRLYVMAGSDATTLSQNGTSLGVLNQGESTEISLNQNDLITANKPIQAHLITGDVDSSYEMRWYTLPPVEDWGNEYFMPVGDEEDNGETRGAVWFYNPNQSAAITVQWQIGSETGSNNVPAGGSVFGPYIGGNDGRTGARFFTTGGEPFYALAQIDTTDGSGEIFDWGFPLLPLELLSPQVLVGNGTGCTEPGETINDDECEFGAEENARSFVWVMPTSGTDVPIYVAYDGSLPVCPATAGSFDTTFTLSALHINAFQEPADLDMTGARIWTCEPGVRLAVAWGQDPQRSYSGDDQAQDQGTAVVPLPSIQVEKSSAFASDLDNDGAISPGDAITYSIAIVNSGAYPANLTFSDVLPAGVTYQAQSTSYRVIGNPASFTAVPDNTGSNTPFPLDQAGLSSIGGNPIVLAPGQVAVMAYAVLINPNTSCTATLQNRAEVEADIPQAASTVSDGNTEDIVLQCNPGIAVEKSTNGQDADTPTGPFIQVGQPVVWSYTVTNIGDVPLTNVTLSDDKLGPITSDCTPAIPATLAVGASFTCEQTGGALAGQYENMATVSANPAGSPTEEVSDQDPSHYFGQDPSLSITKYTNGEDANIPTGPTVEAGSTVNWSYIVVNTGNVPLTNVSVTDDKLGSVSCPATTLAPQQSMTCTASGTALPGQYDNLGTVTGTPPSGPAVTDDDPSHYFGLSPAVEIKKYTNDVDADSAPGPLIGEGNIVVWTYVVTNTGNTDLSVVVSDDQGELVSCPQNVLQPNEQMVCSAFGIAINGDYANTGTVEGTTTNGSVVTDSDPSHYQGGAVGPLAVPTIFVRKFTGTFDANQIPGPTLQAGTTVTWTYFVFNPSAVTLTNVGVIDDQGVTVTCPQNTLASLTGMFCHASDIVQSGQYSNIATATGTPPDSGPIFSSDPSHYFGAVPSITVEKHTNDQDADEAPGPLVLVGDPVIWTYEVVNTGNVRVDKIVVTDDQGVNVSCPQSSLEPQQSMTCVGDAGTAQAGQYNNTATITGVPPSGGPITDTDPSHYFGAEPSVDIQKSTNNEDADDAPGPLIPVGDTVTWRYVVLNTGNVPLSNISVSDDQGVTVNCPANPATLLPGQSKTCTASGVAAADQYTNTGTVTARPPVGPDVTDDDPSHYFGADPAIRIEKLVNRFDADTPGGPFLLMGSRVFWIYVIANTGNVPLTNPLVTDDDSSVQVFCPPRGVLLPRTLMVCGATGTVAAFAYSNIGTVTAETSTGSPVEDDDPTFFFGAQAGIDLEKYTNGADADTLPGPTITIGSPVNWTYVVTNTSNVTVTGVQVTDDPVQKITCPQSTLAAGASMTCTATGVAVEGQYTNTAQVIGIPPAGVEVVDEDPSHYFGIQPTAIDPGDQPKSRFGFFLPQINNSSRDEEQ